MTKAHKANSSTMGEIDANGRPIDLVQLSTQTMGDLSLENEILEIFLKHAEENIALWKDSIDQENKMRAAHSLKGGAKGIGAWELAELANKAEIPGFEDIAELETEAQRVCDYIRLLRKN